MKHMRESRCLLATLFSVLMVLTLCVNLVVPTLADEDGLETATKETETVETTEAAEATEATVESADVLGGIDPTTVREARDALIAKLPQEVLAEHEAILNAPQWDLELCRQDVLDALERNLQATNLEQEFDQIYGEIRDRIQNYDGLTQQEKDTWLDKLGQEKLALEQLETCSYNELFDGLENWETGTVLSDEADIWITKAQAQTQKINQMGLQVDILATLGECDAEISRIGDCLTRENEGQYVVNEASIRYTQLLQQARQLREELEDGRKLDEAALQTLSDAVDTLAQDVSAFAIQVAADNAGAVQSLQLQLKKKMVLVYVAIGVGVVAVLIAAIAVVLAAQKPELDVSALASREDAEKLSEQHKVLQGKLYLLDEKLDARVRAQREETDRLRSEWKDMIKEMSVAAKAAPVVEPVQQTPVVETARRVGYLRLEYNALAAGNAFLEQCGQNTDYILYSDNTVEFVNRKPNSMYNTLVGWSGDGLLYLYDPVLENQIIPVGKCGQYSGYYQPTQTRHRAKVKLVNGGIYQLEEKGAVVMEKA